MAHNRTHATRARLGVFEDDNLYPKLCWIPQGKFRGHRPLKADKGRFTTLSCGVLTDNGWHRARVTRGSRVVYSGKPTRDKAAAFATAKRVMDTMKG